MKTRIIGNVWTLGLLALLTGIMPVQAVTRYWTNSAGGTYNVAGNWDPATVPGTLDILYFTNNATYTVTNSTTLVGAEQYYNASSGVVTNYLTTPITVSSTKILSIGDSSGSTATVVQVGAFLFTANNATVGKNGVGSLTLNGSYLTGAGTFYVGYTNGSSGSSLLVTNGASFNYAEVDIGFVNSANNQAIVSGTGTIWTNTGGVAGFRVGYTNSAFNAFRVEDGARVISQKQLDLGLLPGSSNNTVTVTGTNSYLEVGATSGYLQIGQGDHNNTLIVSNSGSVRILQPFYIGGTATTTPTNNNAIVTGSGSILTNTGLLYVGYLAGGNTLRIEDGGRVMSAGTVIMGRVASGSNNTILVTGSNSLFNINYAATTGNYLEIGTASGNNAMIISNGGAVRIDNASAQGVYVGGTTVGASTNNTILVTGAGSTMSNNQTTVFVGYRSAKNSVSVNDGGQFFATNMMIGSTAVANLGSNNSANVTGPGSLLQVANSTIVGSNSANNLLLIDNGGQVTSPKVFVNGLASGTGNVVRILNRGVLEADTLTVLNAANSVTNFGGIFQFSSATPTVTANGSNIVITNGTIAYRNVTDANITNSQVANMTFQGQNTFRLNAASNTTVSSQTYTFTTNGPASTYARLELINGNTAYRNGNITIGSGGSMLLSNTQATVTGIFTNLGTVTSINAQTMFAGAVYNNGAWVTDPTTQTFASAYTVGTGGTIVMTPGDLMIFSNDFVNQSTQSNTYNTVDGKFLFAGTATTQQFYTAARDLGPGPTPSNPTNVLPAVGGFTANFALGTLEIANFSTVRVSDVTLSLLADNGQRAGLYLNNLLLGLNSYLIVDTNVSVYYYGASGLTGANFLLIGDGELHQLVTPEPSLLLLLVSGGAILSYARKKKA